MIVCLFWSFLHRVPVRALKLFEGIFLKLGVSDSSSRALKDLLLHVFENSWRQPPLKQNPQPEIAGLFFQGLLSHRFFPSSKIAWKSLLHGFLKSSFLQKPTHLSNEKRAWLFWLFRGFYYVPSHMGIISHYIRIPRKPTTVEQKVRLRFFFVAHLTTLTGKMSEGTTLHSCHRRWWTYFVA